MLGQFERVQQHVDEDGEVQVVGRETFFNIGSIGRDVDP